MKKLLPITLLSILMPFLIMAQTATVSGTVTFDEEPAEDVEVILSNYSFFVDEADVTDIDTVSTDENGFYTFEVDIISESDSTVIELPSCPAWNIVSLDSGDDVTQNFDCLSPPEPHFVNIAAQPINDEETEWNFYSYALGGTPASYNWQIDGAIYSDEDVYGIEFGQNGWTNIHLQVSFTDGETAGDTIALNIGEFANCDARFFPANANFDENSISYVNNSLGTDLTYNWDFGDGTTSDEAYPSHVFADDDGEYQVCLYIDGPNCADSLCRTVSLSGGSGLMPDGSDKDPQTGLAKSETFELNIIAPPTISGVADDKKTSNFSVFPNPSNGMVKINMDKPMAPGAELSIIDLSGRVLQSKSLNSISAGTQVQLDISDLAKGQYFIRYEDRDSYGVKKLILQN